MPTLSPDTIAAQLQSWERFFLTGVDTDTGDDPGHEFLIVKARATEDAYLHALAGRVEHLDTELTSAAGLLDLIREGEPLR